MNGERASISCSCSAESAADARLMASPRSCRTLRAPRDAHRLRALLKRQRGVDQALELALLHHLEQLDDVLARPAVGAQDLQLEGPDEADVLLRIEAGRGAAGQQAPAHLQPRAAISPRYRRRCSSRRRRRRCRRRRRAATGLPYSA